MLTLGIVPDPKGREAHFQDFAYVLVLKGVGPSEELLVQKEKKYSLGTFSSGRRLHTIPYHASVSLLSKGMWDKNIFYNLNSDPSPRLFCVQFVSLLLFKLDIIDV